MTVNSNAMMTSYASQVNSNSNVQAQSSASGYASQGVSADFSAIAQQLMSTIDTNKSGSIDKAEFSQAAQALAKNANSSSNSVDTAFAKIDANGDGSISSDEIMNAMKQASAQTQTKKQHHHHHADVSASDTATQTEQSYLSKQASSPANEMQKNLFNKIMAAYSNPTATTGMTTNLSA